MGSIIRRHSKKLRYIVISVLLISLIALFACLSYRYVRKFNATLLTENEAYLFEVADHIAVYTKAVLSDTENTLQNTANVMTLVSDDVRLAYLNDMADRENFAYAGYADKEGNYQCTENMITGDISKEAGFQAAMRGETSISNIEQKILYDRVITGVVITVPIYDSQHKINGVLSAMLDLSKIDSALKIDSFQGNGYAYIIDGNGDLILQNKSVNYSNFYQILESVEITNGDTLAEFKKNVEEKQSGLIHYKQLGEERYAYYQPLDVNDWTIVSIVPKSVITGKTDVLMQELIIMNIGGVIIFFILLFAVGAFWVMSQNQKNSAEAKSAFLADMSHEIRTPMNAIVGTSEILMRGELTSNQEYHIRNILNSSRSLLSIINDILDVSKIESGNFILVEETYELHALFQDITNIAVIRLTDKPVSFQLFADESVPRRLLGDMLRIKQILINIIGNAVKFTQSGSIRVNVTCYEADHKCYLQMEVIDTGIGIHKQDLDKLFISFQQVDTHQNHGKEGTGLGLTIARELCDLMGGTIAVESEYGKGSTFTIKIEQKLVDEEKLMNDFSQRNLRILILEELPQLHEFYKENLQALHVRNYRICSSEEELLSIMREEEYEYILSVPSIVHLKSYQEQKHNAISVTLLKQEEQMQLLTDTNECSIYAPLFGIQLSQLLGSKIQEPCEQEEKKEKKGNPVYPGARVLVVDDNDLNRAIACEIVGFFQLQADEASSGIEAIEMIQRNTYNLVFMDHMMPEMDGVETLQKIRKLPEKQYQELPVIALTANATMEAQAMFKKFGFDGFLGKPIDIDQLEELCEKWLGDQRG